MTVFVKWWTLPPYPISRSVYSLCLFCLLEQLDDLVVASLSGNGQSGLAIGVDLILLCSRSKEELRDLHTLGSLAGRHLVIKILPKAEPRGRCFEEALPPLVAPWPLARPSGQKHHDFQLVMRLQSGRSPAPASSVRLLPVSARWWDRSSQEAGNRRWPLPCFETAPPPQCTWPVWPFSQTIIAKCRRLPQSPVPARRMKVIGRDAQKPG